MRLLILILLIGSQTVFGQSQFAPFREGQSNYITSKQLERAVKQTGSDNDALKKALIKNISSFQDEEEPSFEKLGQAIQKAYESVPGKKSVFNINYPNVLVFMRSSELIDDMLYRLLKEYFDQYYYVERADDPSASRPQGPGLTLKEYISKRASIKRTFDKIARYKNETVASTQLNPFPLKQFKMKAGAHHELSARERIYYLYSPAQIKEMAMIMDLALNIADAKNVYTTIEFRNGNAPMIINHSPTEQYRLALRIMRSQKDEAENDRARLGTAVNDLDLITSAYELGILSYDEVSLVANNKDFYLPEVSFAKKVISYLGSLASIAVRVHPVTAPYAIIPMMIYNSYVEVKKSQAKIDEESFIFSLPKRN